MNLKNKTRVVIEHVSPEIDGGAFPIKRVISEKVVVQADIFADGHDEIGAELLFKNGKEKQWRRVPMRHIGNDIWMGGFIIEEETLYYYTVEAWIDEFATWRKSVSKKHEAGQDIKVELLIGAQIIQESIKKCAPSESKELKEVIKKLKSDTGREETVSVALSDNLLGLIKRCATNRKFITRYERELRVRVDRQKALFSTWYELFPRSWGKASGQHGTFKDCQRLLPEIARMGFDVLYLPPIHPIGKTNRKGRNNAIVAGDSDPGSPWAIGGKEGGHKAIHPQLGSLDDFKHLVNEARKFNIEVALDLAYQCCLDHPYVKEHPEWFKWRPDGTVQFAENPPKKYEDILPLTFDTDDWQNLWQELKNIVLFWVKQGIKIFRVDNPHTKPFEFWDWLIAEVKKDYPDVIFLAEAFTRPKVMYRLAKGGFDQSYTYFTWRNTKREFIEYLTELTESEAREYFRPGFWTNTPDILPQHLQFGGRPAFMMRLVLAATLSSSYGIYGPAFELCVSEAVSGKEEYLNSEKYEIKKWDWDASGNLKDFIARVNQARKDNPALKTTFNLNFCEVSNDCILSYYKATDDFSNMILVVVNLDPHHTQSGWLQVPIEKMGIAKNQTYLAHDLLSNDRYIWQGESNFVELNPHVCPAHILKIKCNLRREQDFDYYM